MANPMAEHYAAEILKLLGLTKRVSFGTEQALAEIVQEAMDDFYNQTIADLEGS